MKLTPGKLAGMKAVANDRGVIAAAAMDQRGSLQKALAKEKGGDVSDAMMEEFKSLVTEVLTPHASAILLDPEWGLPASKRAREERRPAAGLREDRLRQDRARPAAGSARRLVRAPPQGSRRRLHQDPALLHAVRSEGRQRQEARVGRADRRRMPRQRHPVLPGVRRLRRRRRREGPRVREEEAGDRHRRDGRVHEGPLRRRRDEGRSADQHEVRRGREGVRRPERPTRATRPRSGSSRRRKVATKPFIYLSAGVSNAEFTESLALAAESGVRFSGVLCGRATWKDGIPVYAKEGARGVPVMARDQGRREHQQRQRRAQGRGAVVLVLRRDQRGRMRWSLTRLTDLGAAHRPEARRAGERNADLISLERRHARQ